MLDLGFVGLIFSCFDENASNVRLVWSESFACAREILKAVESSLSPATALRWGGCRR